MQESEEDKKKKRRLIIILVILFLIICFLFYWFFFPLPRKVTPTPTDQSTGFSPFDRPSGYKDTNTEVEYAKPAPIVPTTKSPTPAYVPPSYPDEPAPAVGAPAVTQSFYSAPEYKKTFNIPEQNQPVTEEPEVYEAVDTPSTPTGSYYYYVPPYSTTSPVKKKPKPAPTLTEEEKKDDTIKQVFGYLSGLGWTQLLGKEGQQVFDTLYVLLSPSANVTTIAGLFGGGGGGFGGGGGGGWGGAMQNFGGSVTQVTYCTCSSSIMLDIKDVRGSTISIIYQPGASTLYENYNVFGTNQNVLGTYTSGGTCLVVNGPKCSTQGSPRGTIRIIGTSKN